LADIAAQYVGDYRSVHFRAGKVNPVAARLDLLIVGMPEISHNSCVEDIICPLDAALSGTLSHLRTGSVFNGRFGETLILSSPPPPVRSGSLMIIGMGDADLIDPQKLGSLATIAMRAAAHLDGRHIACLLSLPTTDVPSHDVASAARAVMAGTLKAIDEHHDTHGFAAMDWIFDLHTVELDLVAGQLKSVLDRWTI
jgi:hypothetical protein